MTEKALIQLAEAAMMKALWYWAGGPGPTGPGAVRHPGACVFVLLDCELSLLVKIIETPRNALDSNACCSVITIATFLFRNQLKTGTLLLLRATEFLNVSSLATGLFV